MTDMERQLQELRWRVGIFEVVFVRLSGEILSQFGISPHTLSELLAGGVDAMQQINEQVLGAEPDLEKREQLVAAYRQLCENIRQELAGLLTGLPSQKA